MRKIVFLYENAGGFRIKDSTNPTISGNVQMRVFDVVNDLKKYHPELDVYCYEFEDFFYKNIYKQHKPEECILLINKGCFQIPDGLEKLYKSGYVMVSDMIDFSPDYENLFVAHISSSVGLHSYLSTNFNQPVYHVIHGYDRYFDRDHYTLEQSDILRITYCGACNNINDIDFYMKKGVKWIDPFTWWKKEFYYTNWTDELSKEEFLLMRQRKYGEWCNTIQKYLQPQTHDWKDQLKYYNCHIGLRKYDRYAPYKPFTKGFTAAALRSPIVVDRFNRDACYYLPSDYPLFSPIEGEVKSKEQIITLLQHILSKYQTPEWDYALECMETLYDKCNSKKIAKRWKTVFQKIEQLL